MYLTVLIAGFGDGDRPVSELHKALASFHESALPPGECSYARFPYGFGARSGEPLTNAPFELMKERLSRFVRACASRLGVDLEGTSEQRKDFHLHLVGYGTGGMIALYALAHDRALLSACRKLVSLDAPHTGIGLGVWPAFMTTEGTAPLGMGWQLLQLDRGAFVRRYIASVREGVFPLQSALLGREDVLQLHPVRVALGGNPFDLPVGSVDVDHEHLANDVASITRIQEFLFGELAMLKFQPLSGPAGASVRVRPSLGRFAKAQPILFGPWELSSRTAGEDLEFTVPEDAEAGGYTVRLVYEKGAEGSAGTESRTYESFPVTFQVTSALAPRIDGWGVLTPQRLPLMPWESALPGCFVRMWGRLRKGDVAVFEGQPRPTRFVTDPGSRLQAEFTLPQVDAPGTYAFLLRHVSPNGAVHDSASQTLRVERDTRCRLEPAWGFPGEEISLVYENGALEAGCQVFLKPPTGGPDAAYVTLPSTLVDGRLRFQVPEFPGQLLSVHCRFSHGERSQDLPLTVAPFLHPFAEGTLAVPGERVRLRGRFTSSDTLWVNGTPCAANFSEEASGACWSFQVPDPAPSFLFQCQVRHEPWASNAVELWVARYIANLSKSKRELHTLDCKSVPRMAKKNRLPVTEEQAGSLRAGGFDNCHYCLGGSTR